MMNKPVRKEDHYYPLVKTKLEELLSSKGKESYLEITANGFSNRLKDAIPDNKGIIFSFLGAKGARPDITGFVCEKYSKEFIVVEIKNESIKLDDIYQLRKYTDLFDAKFAFLVSTNEIPTEIRKLSKVSVFLLWRSTPYPPLSLVRYDETKNELVDWYEKDVFHDEYYWK